LSARVPAQAASRLRQVGATVLGAATVAGFEPAGLGWLPPVTLAALIVLWARAPSPRAAARLGFLFGLGFFGCGVSWVYVSLHEFGMMPAALAALATAFFCAYLALFPALVGSLQARFRAPAALRAMALVPPLWVLCEWLRGWLLSGFPWLAVGYSQADTPLSGYAPVAGVYGVSLALCTCAAALAGAVLADRRTHRIAALALAVLVYGGGSLLRNVQWTEPRGDAIGVSLVQGNVGQSMKFEPSRYQATLDAYRRLVDSARGRLVVLPETAIPRFLDLVDEQYLRSMAERARAAGKDVLVGAPFRNGAGRYYNGVVTLGASPVQFFAKRHLVPLGEFVPPEFGWIIGVLRIPLSDFSPGGAQQPLRAAGERLAMTVCYEDAFGEELVTQLPEATLLVNVSNVAWFGRSLAPEQHLQISRMRSLETGRYMMRATNTGATAIIDERGRVTARLPPYVEGVLEGEARPFIGATPYVRYANTPVLALCALELLLSVIGAIRPRRSDSRPGALHCL
jgi:apolipoprotein N-acyltransferase